MSFEFHNFDIEELFRIVKHQLRKEGLEVSDEELREALLSFQDAQNSLQGKKASRFKGIFRVKAFHKKGDRKPKVEFSFFSKDRKNSKVQFDKLSIACPDIEFLNYEDKVIAIVDIKGAVKDTLDIRVVDNKIELFALAPHTEYYTKFPIKDLDLDSASIESNFNNGICEITINKK